MSAPAVHATRREPLLVLRRILSEPLSPLPSRSLPAPAHRGRPASPPARTGR